MNGGSLVVRALKEHGVEHLFGLVDTTFLDILDALHGEPSIRYIPVRHEEVASMAADAYARCAGRPGVCISQCGAGAMHLLYGVSSAFKDSVPLVAITGNIDLAMIGRDAWHDIDVVELFRPVTKSSMLVRSVDDIPRALHDAFRTAQSGRPGPVHVSIPKDLQAKASDAPALRPSAPARPALDRAQLGKAVDLLAGARKPIILAGGGVLWARAERALTEFSERSAIPVIVTDTARGTIPEHHANALGPAGLFGSKAATEALKEADVIVGVGTRFPDLTTGNWEFIKSAALIQNNIEPDEIGKRVPVAVGVVGDAGEFLQALSAAWPLQQDRAARSARNRALKDAVEAERAAFLTPPPGEHSRIPIHLVVRELAQALEGKAVLAIDGGLHTSFSGRLQINAPRSWLVSAGLGAMGYSLPAAIGAKLADPGRDVVALVGDGGFAMVLQDLETAVRCEIPIVVVVYSNGAFGAQRLRQQRDYGARMIGTSFSNPDYAAVAKLYGAEGRRVTRIEEFRPALEQALGCGRPAVIDVLIA